MSTLALPVPPRTATLTPTTSNPVPKIWTVLQFHAMGDAGLLENCRAKLVDGVIFEEGPMNPPHGIALEATDAVVRKAFGAGWRFRVQMPLVFGQTIDPQPDLAIVRGSLRGVTAHPATADLVIEISDTSLVYDTTEKMHLYAAAGILDYWVLDVNARQLFVFRDPIADAAAPRGFQYATTLTFAEADTVMPLAVPTATMLVRDMLP